MPALNFIRPRRATGHAAAPQFGPRCRSRPKTRWRSRAQPLPGLGTVEHLKMAHALGVPTLRVATHGTEADGSGPQIRFARALARDTVDFLRMAPMNSVQGLVKQALRMRRHGAHGIGTPTRPARGGPPA